MDEVTEVLDRVCESFGLDGGDRAPDGDVSSAAAGSHTTQLSAGSMYIDPHVPTRERVSHKYEEPSVRAKRRSKDTSSRQYDAPAPLPLRSEYVQVDQNPYEYSDFAVTYAPINDTMHEDGQ
jgi:hypothetical protein